MASRASIPRRLRSSFGLWLVVGNIVLAAIVCTATYRNLALGTATDLERAGDAAQNLADSVGAELSAELRLIDNALITVAKHIRVHDIDRLDLAQPHVNAEIADQQALIPFVAAIRLAGLDGRVVRDSPAGPEVNVADRDYFLRALHAEGPVLSEPTKSRLTDRWSLVMARRLTDPGGQPAGVVYAVIESAHFKDLFSRLSLGAGGAISLRTQSARLVARFSRADPTGDIGLGSSTVSRELQAAVAGPDPSGTFRTTTALDGIDRINAYRRVPGFPLVLVAGLSTRDYVTPWIGETRRQWAFTAAVLLLLWGGSAYVYWQHRRVRRALLKADGLAAEQRLAHESERRLKEQVQSLATELGDLYDHAPCAHYSLDAEGRFCRVNSVMCHWLACSEAELLGRRSPDEFFDEAGVKRCQENFPILLAGGEIGPLEFDLTGADGTQRHVSVRATAVRDEDGKFICSRSVMYDITALDAARNQLRKLASEQGAMLSNDLMGIVRLKERRIVWSNPASERIFGYGPGELNGRDVRELYPSSSAYEALGREAYDALAAAGRYRTQVELVTRDRRPIVVDVSGARLAGTSDEYLWMLLDITEMRRQHERVEFVAFHDGLTGLANRALLMDRLHQAIELCRRTREPLAVCFLDLDGFKLVNDVHGHAAGDRLLQEVARRLASQVRSHDTIARVGGDEFVIVMTSLHSAEQASDAVARIRRAIAVPVQLADGQRVQVRASIGQACWLRDGDDAESLLTAADRAMYRDKSARSATRDRAVALPL